MKYVLTILILSFTHLYSQGCSDAGFCTMGAMRPNQKFNKKLNLKIRSIEYTSYVGYTHFVTPTENLKDYFLSQIIDANIGITAKSTIQIKLPVNTTIGNLATITGLSDLSLSYTNNLLNKDKYSLNGSLGMKIPTSRPNNTNSEGKPLPMYYQPTLGTYDFITGLSLSTSKWMFATGFQSPLNYNKNEFLWAPWNKTSDSAIANVYPRANGLKRGYDVMLRAERNFRFSKWNAYIGVLPIYRLKKDEFFNKTTKKYDVVEGSDGLATTLLIGGGYKFSHHSSLKVLFGRRITKRKINPDGLSRVAVTSFTYEYSF